MVQINGQYGQIAVVVLDEKMKNKKSEKFIYKKSRNDSVVRKAVKPGCGLIFAQYRKRYTIHARHGRIVFIFCVLLVTLRAYNCETAFLRLFVRRVRSYLRVRSIASAAKIRA